MALLNVSQYTRIVDYVHMMTGPVFISIQWFIAQFELAMTKIQKGKVILSKTQSSDALTAVTLY